MTLDLESRLGKPSAFRSRPECVVLPEAWPELCHATGKHLADATVTFTCGCSYSYCKNAVRELYAPRQLSDGICPIHGYQKIMLADWI